MSCLSCNFSLWQQLSRAGCCAVANLAVLGNLTKYSVVPDLVTEDELESMMVLACSSSTDPKEELGFAGFLSLLELVAESVPAAKLTAKLPDLPEDSHKLANVLIIAARNMLQRKAFSCAMSSGDQLAGEVRVFDDDLLASTGISDEALLGWLRQANAIQVPHVQIPLIHSFLQALAAERAELLLRTGSVERRQWKASTVTSVLYAVVKHLSTLTNTTPLSEELELCYLLRQLPGLFFCACAAEQASVGPGLHCLYSAHTAPLLQDSVVEVNLALHALWTALGAVEESMEEAALRSDNFIASFGTARTRVHRVLGFLQESGLVPTIFSSTDVLSICGLVMCEETAAFSEDSRISQGRLLEALYCLALSNWPVLENLRRRRGLSAPPSKLSDRQPQHNQQVFQTFLYLLGFQFPLDSPQDTQVSSGDILDARPAEEHRQVLVLAQNSGSIEQPSGTSAPALRDRLQSGIPVPVPKQTPQLPAAAGPHSAPLCPSPQQQVSQAFHQLAVSFNSHRRIDRSHVGDKSPLTAAPHSTHSFFSDHPLRDIAVLLVHFPVSNLALSPWTVLELLKQNSAAFAQALREHGERPSDAQLTSLLVRFCRQYEVSADDLSEFFAQYYLTEEEGTSSVVPTGDAASKERVMRDPVLDCLLTEELVPDLQSHADTLKWEYARCFAQLRVSTGDPFAESIVTPFLTSEDCSLHCDVCMLPATAAANWAVQYAGLSSSSAEQQLSQLRCLTGLSTGALTFSAFTVFAVRCFTAVLFDTTSGPPEEQLFASTVRRELSRLAHSRAALEQALQLQVLRPLFAGPAQYSSEPLQQSEAGSALTAALGIFNSTLGGSPQTPTAQGPSAGDGRIPPRPPRMLWDAPRFVQFCRDFGILGKFSWSQCACWDAFGSYLRTQSVPGLDSWDSSIVPPMPLRLADSTMFGLIETVLVHQKEEHQWRLYHKTLVPVVCTLGGLASCAGRVGQDGLRVEDLLRLGGSASMGSLLGAQDYLRVAYASLTRTALPSLLRPSGAPIPIQAAEVPLNILCRFFACANILRAAAVAVQAKRSLQVRIRPVLCTRVAHRSAPIEVVTLSYSEFEEVFLRCAFLLWETSGAHTQSSSLADKAVLLGQAQFQQQPIPSIAVRAVEAYVGTCSAERQSSASTASQARTGWGVDFVAPYLEALQAIGEVAFECRAVAQLKVPSVGRTASADSDNSTASEGNRKTVRFGQDTVLNAAQTRDNAGTTELLARRSDRFLSVATDIGEHPRSEAAQVRMTSSQQLTPGSSSERSRRSFPRSPSTSSSSPQLPLQELRDWDAQRHSRDSSPSSAKMQTSQRIILSSTERFLLQQESSQQFVVAVDALLMGTKEALWPVYATYCSCGDSLDPGKLSGPNLFTLLSKLGVLTDDTRLSAVGILLHQTAAHVLTGASVISMAVLYEAEAYYESPSLSFEEFIVFLCAFSQLRYGGEVLTAEAFRQKLSSLSQPSTPPPLSPDNWFRQWREYMGASDAFRHLLGDCVLPILRKQMLLAFPEDARLRDCFCCVFSLEVLIAIEGVEEPLKKFFENERQSNASANTVIAGADVASEGARSPSPCHAVNSSNISSSKAGEAEIVAIVVALKRISLIPGVMAESQVMQLVRDVLPEETSRRRAGSTAGDGTAPRHVLLFPQWEWVLSVVAFHAVQAAIEQSDVPTEAEVSNSAAGMCLLCYTAYTYYCVAWCPQKIPAMVADVITSIAAAITVNA